MFRQILSYQFSLTHSTLLHQASREMWRKHGPVAAATTELELALGIYPAPRRSGSIFTPFPIQPLAVRKALHITNKLDLTV